MSRLERTALIWPIDSSQYLLAETSNSDTLLYRLYLRSIRMYMHFLLVQSRDTLLSCWNRDKNRL